MALVDVTELLIDPDFVNDITIIHRVPTVNSAGENTLVETSVATIGSVQPASGKTLLRLPELLRVADVYDFFVKGQIVSDGTTSYPDILVFNSVRYQVQKIQDYMNWPGGNFGWCQGTAIREVPTL